MAKRIVGIEVKRLLQGVFGVLEASVAVKQEGMPPVGFGVARVGRHDLSHDAQGRFMLTLLVLSKGPFNLDMDREAAPLEFFAAATRTRRIGVECHENSRSSLKARGATVILF